MAGSRKPKAPEAASKTDTPETEGPVEAAADASAAASEKPADAVAAEVAEDIADAPSDEPVEIEAEFEPAESPVARIAAMHVSMPVALALAAAASVLGGVFGVVFDGGGRSDARASADVDTKIAAFDERLRALRQAMAETGGEGGGVASAALADLEAELASVRDDVAQAASRLAVIESANGDSEAAAAIAARLDAIAADAETARLRAEEALAAPNALSSEVESLGTRLNTVADTVRVQGRAIDQLSSSTSVLTRRVTGVSAPTRLAATGAAAALSLANLQDAALSGRPFATEYEAAMEYFSDSADMIVLGDFAEAGAPTPAALAASFRSAAAAARDAERPQGGGFIDRLARGVTGLVTVRRLDAPATDTAADVVVRAQRRLSQNDLAGAVAEMARLTGPSAEAAAQWIAEAGARVEVEARLEAIQQSFSES